MCCSSELWDLHIFAHAWQMRGPLANVTGFHYLYFAQIDLCSLSAPSGSLRLLRDVKFFIQGTQNVFLLKFPRLAICYRWYSVVKCSWKASTLPLKFCLQALQWTDCEIVVAKFLLCSSPFSWSLSWSGVEKIGLFIHMKHLIFEGYLSHSAGWCLKWTLFLWAERFSILCMNVDKSCTGCVHAQLTRHCVLSTNGGLGV